MGTGQHVEDAIGHEPDHDDVAERARARPLPERDPRQEHHRTDDVDDPADLDVEMAGYALVQHVPGVEAESTAYEQGQSSAEADQGGEEPREAKGQAHGPSGRVRLLSGRRSWHVNEPNES